MIEDPADLIRVMADPLRLVVQGRAAGERVALAEVAKSMGTTKRKAAEGVGRPRAAGLIDDNLRLVVTELRRLVESLPAPDDAATTITQGPWSDEEKDVLRRFFSGTRCSAIEKAKRTNSRRSASWSTPSPSGTPSTHKPPSTTSVESATRSTTLRSNASPHSAETTSTYVAATPSAPATATDNSDPSALNPVFCSVTTQTPYPTGVPE